jgi:dTMP kinase
MAGFLIAIEGLDQSGKETQARLLQQRLVAAGHQAHIVDFPDYSTSIGGEIGRALAGGRDYGPDVLQLLFIANRYEIKPRIERWMAEGAVVICDRYEASSIAYGEAHGVDTAWLTDVQRLLPRPDCTLLIDIEPEVAAHRKSANRDRFERDLDLLSRVRASYLRQAGPAGWFVIDGNRDRAVIADDIAAVVCPRVYAPAPITSGSDGR